MQVKIHFLNTITIKIFCLILSTFLMTQIAFAQNLSLKEVDVDIKEAKESKEVKNIKVASTTCEVSLDLNFKLEYLESKSSTTKMRIKDLNLTLKQEIEKRANIVNTVKNIFTFKKTDKQILEEIQIISKKAEVFYSDLDFKLEDQRLFSDKFNCKDLKEKERMTEVNDLSETYKIVEFLEKDEDKYRKTFIQNVKQKMQIISKELDSKKEKQIKIEKKLE